LYLRAAKLHSVPAVLVEPAEVVGVRLATSQHCVPCSRGDQQPPGLSIRTGVREVMLLLCPVPVRHPQCCVQCCAPPHRRDGDLLDWTESTEGPQGMLSDWILWRMGEAERAGTVQSAAEKAQGDLISV